VINRFCCEVVLKHETVFRVLATLMLLMFFCRRKITEATLIDLFLLAECDYFVGGFSSGRNQCCCMMFGLPLVFAFQGYCVDCLLYVQLSAQWPMS
jgi:hypothetical protein